MKNEVSIFIMGVRNNPSNEAISSDIDDYLQELQINISYWTQNINPTKVKVSERTNSELLVVSEGFATAYTLAFYLSRIWRFPESPPYFGLSFGHIEEEIRELNLESWRHPLIEQARGSKNSLKPFHFGFSEVGDSDIYKNPFEVLLNTSLRLNQEQLNAQTAIQAHVFSLYLLMGQQNKVSKYLERTKSTISSHMKNGKTELIMQTFHHIIEVLNMLEADQSKNRTDKLQESIKINITLRMSDYLQKDI